MKLNMYSKDPLEEKRRYSYLNMNDDSFQYIEKYNSAYISSLEENIVKLLVS